MDQVRAFRPPVPGVAEVLHASFAEFAYPAHAHHTWTLLMVDDGVVRYDLDRHAHGSDRAGVTLLPPHVVHDGRPGSGAGFRKRVIYLDGDVFAADLIGPAVDRPWFTDPLLRIRLSALHAALQRDGDGLEAESRLALIIDRLGHHLRPAAPPRPEVRPATLAEQLRAVLDRDPAAPVTLSAAGAEIAAHPAHLVRAFTAAFGLPPHAYQVGRRVELARRMLLDGRPVADVATGSGFYDQAHLTRHFKRYTGTTPGRFAGRHPTGVR